MREGVARFSKVSFEQFNKDFADFWKKYTGKENVALEEIREIYDNISLPKRATTGSAGYDFFAPFNFMLGKGETIKFPTGIRAFIKDGYVLKLYPRSSLGFKYRMQLDNTVGIIDSDYFHSSNEGHIFAKFTNDSVSKKDLIVGSGDAYMQGIFEQYFLTDDDEVTAIRDGGFGSTNNQ